MPLPVSDVDFEFASLETSGAKDERSRRDGQRGCSSSSPPVSPIPFVPVLYGVIHPDPAVAMLSCTTVRKRGDNRREPWARAVHVSATGSCEKWL